MYREIITPLKDKPFRRIKDPVKRAVFILHLADFSYRKIHTLFKIDKMTVMRWVTECYRKYPTVKKPKF